MLTPDYNIFFALVTSFLITYVAIPKVIFFAQQFRLTDVAGERAAHEGSTPIFGGIAIFSGIIFSLLFWADLENIQLLLASFLIVENAIFLVFLLLGLFWTGSRLVVNEILLIIIVPIILSFTAHTFLSLFNHQDLLFSPFIFDKNHVIVNNINWEFLYTNKYLFLLIFIFIYAMILAITRKYRYQERVYIARRIFFAIIILTTIILVSPTSGMEFHYLGLVMVYFMEYFYRKHSNKIFLNFFFVSLIISYLLFTFVLK